MLFNIPQFIDKEDKLVGPLTAKQLGWLIGGAVVAFIFWTFLATTAFYIVAVIIAGISCALAFYHPNGQPLINFMFSSVSFFSSPRMYIWKRVPEKEGAKKVITENREPAVPKKAISTQKIDELSRILDNRK